MFKEVYGLTQTEYCTVGKYVSEKAPWLHPRRKIDSFVLLYGVSETVHIADGNRSYALTPNNYLILAANREHVGTKPSSPGVSYYWCHFYIRGKYMLQDDAAGHECITFGENGAFHMPMFGRVNASSKMHLIFHQLIDSARTAMPFSKFICHNFLEILLAEIAGTASGEKQMPDGNAVVQNITEWIRLNASQVRQVRDVAEHFGYNSDYLTTLLKKNTGKSLVRHINESRVEYAKELLRTTNCTVCQIADQCGFSDEKYFSRIFKKYCDVSPTVFRNTFPKQHTNNK